MQLDLLQEFARIVDQIGELPTPTMGWDCQCARTPAASPAGPRMADFFPRYSTARTEARFDSYRTRAKRQFPGPTREQ